MPVAFLYQPEGHNKILLPSNSLTEVDVLVESFAEKHGRFALFPSPKTKFDITPVNWAARSLSRYVAITGDTIESVAIEETVSLPEGKKTIEPGQADLTPAHATVVAEDQEPTYVIETPHRNAESGLYEIGGLVMFVTIEDIDRLASMIPQSNRYGDMDI